MKFLSTLVFTIFLLGVANATTIDFKNLNDGFPAAEIWKPNSLEKSWTKTSSGIDVLSYKIEMIVAKDGESIDFSQEIQFKTNTDRKRISFDAGDELKIHSVNLNGNMKKFFHNEAQLSIFSNTQFSKNKTYKMQVFYQVELKGNPALTAHREDEKITQIASFTQPLRSRSWFVAHDLPGDKAKYEMLAHIPKPWMLMTNGTLNSQMDNVDGYSTYSFTMRDPIPTYLISIVIGEFKVYEDVWKGVPLSYWYDEAAGEKGLEVMKETPKMLDYFEKRYFKYPFEKYNITGTRAMVGGAMEHTTATTFDSTALPSEQGETIALHELAHHWFGDTVTCGDWDHLWLNESFATFSQIDYIRYNEGQVAYVKFLQERKNRYFGTERVNGALGPIVNYESSPRDKMFGPMGTVTYDKGSIVLNYLRVIVGDELFFKTMTDYLLDNKLYMKAGFTSDFHRHLERVTGEDFTWFFNQYIFKKGRPQIKVTQTSTQKFKIEQTSSVDVGTYTLKIPVELHAQDKSKSSSLVVMNSPVMNFEVEPGIYTVIDPLLELPAEMTLDYLPEVSKWLLANSELSSAFSKLLLDDLGRKKALDFQEWSTLVEKNTTRIGVKASLVTYGLKYLDLLPVLSKASIQPFSEQASDIRLAILQGLTGKKLSETEKESLTPDLIQMLEKETMLYDIVVPLADLMAENGIDITTKLRELIQLGDKEGSYFFGFNLRSLAKLIGIQAYEEYKSYLSDKRGNYRARAAFGFSVLKEDQVSKAIGETLLVEYQKEDYSNHRSFAIPKILESLFSIRTAQALSYLNQFLEVEEYSEEEKNIARDYIKRWE
ncbi:MAG: M1 family metallopeptidase [Bdellovibrionales bacterium]